MKLYLKVIGGSCYTCLPQTTHAAQSVLRKMAPGTPPKDQRLLTNTWPKTRQQHKHTCIQRLTLRNITSLHKTALKTNLELFYTLQ